MAKVRVMQRNEKGEMEELGLKPQMMTEELTELIGTESLPNILGVERGAIRRYAQAIEDSNPLFNDVEYAKKKNRPVEYGDVCDLDIPDRTYNVSFAHHLLGLVPDYEKAYAEMLRVIKAGGFVVTLDNIPGNPRKHYQIMESSEQLRKIIDAASLHINEVVNVVFFDKYPLGQGDEFLVVLQRSRKKRK